MVQYTHNRKQDHPPAAATAAAQEKRIKGGVTRAKAYAVRLVSPFSPFAMMMNFGLEYYVYIYLHVIYIYLYIYILVEKVRKSKPRIKGNRKVREKRKTKKE